MPEDAYILNVPAFTSLRRAIHNFETKKIPKTVYKNTAITFFNWYASFCDSVVKGKTYKDDQIVPHVFRARIKTDFQRKEFLVKNYYLIKLIPAKQLRCTI